MMRTLVILAVALGGCTESPDFAFKNASITLPDAAPALASGPNVDLVTANCTGCHSADMINNQPALAKPAWEATVTKMVKVYKAPIAEADMPKILDYLVSRKVAGTVPPHP